MTTILYPDAWTVEVLRDAVTQGTHPELDPALALSLLAEKDYPERERDLSSVLADQQADPRLRLVAAQALGRLRTDAARAALLAALTTPNPLVLRGVVSGLAEIGGQAALEQLRGIDLEQLDYRTRVELAQAAYSVNASGFDLQAPEERTLLDIYGREARQVIAIPVPEDDAGVIWAYWQEEGMLIAADTENALGLNCLGRELVIFLNRTLRTARPAELTQQRWLAGVILLHEAHADDRGEAEDEDDDEWSYEYSVLTQPGNDGALGILVTSGARIQYAGTGKLNDGRLDFSLRAVDLPGARAAVIEGSYERGALRLTRVEVAVQGQPRLRPQRLR